MKGIGCPRLMHVFSNIRNGVRMLFSLQVLGRQNCRAGESEQNQPMLAGGLGKQHCNKEGEGPGGKVF